MDRVVDYIEMNMQVIKTLVKIGRMPLSTMTDYDIYMYYKSILSEPYQMKKYLIVAKKFKCSVATVRRAVSAMENKL
jgi:hypothetical protein